MNAILAARGVAKHYGAVAALAGADIELVSGRVGAIVGENGAGKSTLAKILAGIVVPDRGEVLLDGAAVRFRRRLDAARAGVGFVPQSLSFVATLTIVENHLLGRGGLALDGGGARRALIAAADELGVGVDVERPVERLSLAERQLGEIVSAVAHGARVLILDEPTSTLGPFEIERLIEALRRLAARGTAIGLVTHRVREVLQGADHVTVLRAGGMVFSGPTSGLDAERVAGLMVGERDRARPELPARSAGPPRLVVAGLSLAEAGATLLEDVGFDVAPGEILGVAGVAGPAQPALAEAIAGLRSPLRGRVLVDGRDVTGCAAAAAASLAYIPEGRALGLASDRTVAENAALLRLAETCAPFTGLRRPAAERRIAQGIIERFDVRPPRPEMPAAKLSGGNQQKLLVGRELDRAPAVVVAHGPTQGLDLAAAAEIRAGLVAAAARGAAVLLISADLDEILDMSHRLIVLAGRHVTGRFDLVAERIDMGRLGAAMAATTAEECV